MQRVRSPKPRGIVVRPPPRVQVQWLQLRVLQAQLTLQEASAKGPQLPELVAHLQLRCQLEIDSQGEEPSSEARSQLPRDSLPPCACGVCACAPDRSSCFPDSSHCCGRLHVMQRHRSYVRCSCSCRQLDRILRCGASANGCGACKKPTCPGLSLQPILCPPRLVPPACIRMPQFTAAVIGFWHHKLSSRKQSFGRFCYSRVVIVVFAETSVHLH